MNNHPVCSHSTCEQNTLRRHIYSCFTAHISMSHVTLAQDVCPHHVIHASCAVVVLILFDSPCCTLHRLSHFPFHSPDLHLQLPCGLVRREVQFSSRSPPATAGPQICMTWRTMTLPSAERSLHHCSLRSEKIQRLISNVRENPRRDPEDEQITILLERQKKQILADYRAEIRKHEFQADYDRRNIPKLNGVIESQRGEMNRVLQGDEQHRRDQQLIHEQLLEQNRDFREAHEKSLNEMEELKRFQGSTFNTISRRKLAKIEILSLNSQARFRNTE